MRPLLNIKEKNNLKVLEIGCGNGFFLEELKDNGFKRVYGIEPGKMSVKKARPDIKKNIKISILKENLFPKNYFDIICCFHTLDHIVEPNVFIKEIKFLLKKNGKVFFVVHNTSSLSAKLMGENSPIFDIEHIYLFNKGNLIKIFKKNNIKNLKVFDIKNTYQLNYWIKLFPMPHKLKSFILNFKNSKILSRSISLRAGNIGIIGEK